jgi:DNA-binding CsgD family transcriptional regulator
MAITDRRGPGRRKPNAADIAAKVKRMERRAQVLALRVEGLDTRAIAARLNVSIYTVSTDLQKALIERGTSSDDNARKLAHERLETIIAAHMPTLLRGFGQDKLDATKAVLAAIALDARILGYEAPKNITAGTAQVVIKISQESARAFDGEIRQLPELPELPEAVSDAPDAEYT